MVAPISEWLLYKSVNILLKVELADTLRHLERKKTRTHTEMNREMYDELKRDDELKKRRRIEKETTN